MIAHPLTPTFTSLDSTFSLYQGDCNALLPQMKESFDVIFADPPYFLSNDGLSIQSGKIVSVNKGQWDRGENIDEIDRFCRNNKINYSFTIIFYLKYCLTRL